MAVLPLNTFRTIARELNVAEQTLYTCPTGVTGIILMAQVSNISSVTSSVTFKHVRGRTATELLKNAPIPMEDARSMLTGRLVLEEGDRIVVSASAASTLKITLSLVESANT
jgi:hypothetical protein